MTLKLDNDIKSQINIELLSYNEAKQLWYYNNEPLIKLLYPNKKIVSIKFINKDYNDYKKINLKVGFKDTIILPDKYKIIKEFEPHLISNGRHSGEYKNKYWLVEENEEQFYIMYIKDNIFTKFSCESLNKIIKYESVIPSWCILPSRYIYYKYINKDIIKHLYMHQLVMNVEDVDLSDLTHTIDHINRDKLDNRLSNLRIVNMSVQNSNRDKPTRRKDACDLPHGIEQTDLPKYVCYRKEILDEDTNNFREFFYIKHHPKLDKVFESSKSNKISLTEKLDQIKTKLKKVESNDVEIEEDITENAKDIAEFDTIKKLIKLPQYCTLSFSRNKLTLLFEKKTEDKRLSLTYVVKTNNLQHDLNEFIKDINKKYPDINISNYTIPVNLLNKVGLNGELTITEPEEKLILPPNFVFCKEKEAYYYSYSKYINKKRYNKKYKLMTNDLQKELNIFLDIINELFKDNIHIDPYLLTNIPTKNNTLSV